MSGAESRQWQPGDVAWLTVYGQSSYLGMRSAEMGGSWVTAAPAAGVHLHGSHDVTDARPLVVVDPEQITTTPDAARYIARLLREADENNGAPTFAALADAFDPKPPKPDEPTGLGAVVEDANGRLWVRIPRERQFSHFCWSPDNGAAARIWDVIDAVRVLSEGVTA